MVPALIERISKSAWASEYRFSREIVLRGLGLCYAVAFLSLGRQANGLIGSQGLLPASAFLSNLRHDAGGAAFLRTPTLFWLGASNGSIHVAIAAGLVLSLAAIAGYGSAVAFGALWALYSSFVAVGQGFFDSGPDLLLLEAGFLAIFLANPWHAADRRASPPRVVVWLLRALLVRVLVAAGLSNLRGDPCWQGLACYPDAIVAASDPSIVAFAVRRLPRFVHATATAVVLFSELAAPWGLIAGRKLRNAAAVFIACAELAGIAMHDGAASNAILAVLAAACIDDAAWSRVLSRSASRQDTFRSEARSGRAPPHAGTSGFTARGIVLAIVCALVGSLTVLQLGTLWSPGVAPAASLEPFHVVNVYASAAPLEHERREVVYEGTSDDAALGAARWLEYDFPCKPGNPDARPCLGSPYPHRLADRLRDAALGDFRREPWTLKLAYELLRGNTSVTALASNDPFDGSHPRYVRVSWYRYRFASKSERGYWRRDRVGDFIRPVSIDDPALSEYLSRRGWLRD